MSNCKRKKGQKTYNKEFLDAVCNGDVRTVKEMLEKHQVNVNNTCALYKASKAGHVSVVQELIKAGADVNMSHSLEGRTFTPLQAACNYGCCAEVIQELLKAGAKVDLQDDSGKSALLLLLESTHISSESKVPITCLTFFSNDEIETSTLNIRRILRQKDPAEGHHGSRLMTGFLSLPTAPTYHTDHKDVPLATPEYKVRSRTFPRLPKLFQYVNYQPVREG